MVCIILYIKDKKINLLKEVPAEFSGLTSGRVIMSVKVPEIPASDNLISKVLESSVNDVCLTFSAIAPMA